ncbi:hypothetical protein I312_105367 [Cryptococcus bacillisporus CA1280]|uniref:uncharacterized protein n=1 Tax=Cryptococcus bacillisporus CA1280 TaxID=1296109 RepID=UPI0033683E4A
MGSKAAAQEGSFVDDGYFRPSFCFRSPDQRPSLRFQRKRYITVIQNLIGHHNHPTTSTLLPPSTVLKHWRKIFYIEAKLSNLLNNSPLESLTYIYDIAFEFFCQGGPSRQRTHSDEGREIIYHIYLAYLLSTINCEHRCLLRLPTLLPSVVPDRPCRKLAEQQHLSGTLFVH